MSSLQPSTPPSAAAYAIAALLVGALGGYFFGQASSLGLLGRTKPPLRRKATKRRDSGSSSSAESDSDAIPVDQQDLANFADRNEECKLVLVVRTDLGMTKGKIAAQCGHATLACYKSFLRNSPDSPVLHRWERYGQAKVAVQIKSEEGLEDLQARALSLGLCAQVIHDAGRTQIASGSATVLGVGPGPKSVIDTVTGHLKLL